MEATDYLHHLVNEMHCAVVATVDDTGLPVTTAVDMLDCDGSSVSFPALRGTGLYRQLEKQQYLSLTATRGRNILTLRGNVRCLGNAAFLRLLEKNPSLYVLYPTEESRKNPEIFQLYNGSGEWLHRGGTPIRFFFGTAETEQVQYIISDACLGCGICAVYCPGNCMDFPDGRAQIQQSDCLHCGKCMEVCPAGAVTIQK